MCHHYHHDRIGPPLDGTVEPWEHIAADQTALLALFVIHTSAILRRARDPRGCVAAYVARIFRQRLEIRRNPR
jgi:hypothetical protein